MSSKTDNLPPLPPGGSRVEHDGHVYGVVELDPGDMLDLFAACEDRATNAGYVGYASRICSVRDIDGVPIPFPASKEDIKALGRRIGAPALNAVIDASAQQPAADAEAAKN